ncbi:AfsR/SARP family transcriptional regulator [Lysobacter terrae]
MPSLRVRTFGGLSVAGDGGREIAIPASCRPVLGYMLVHQRRHVSRGELAEALWSTRDGQRARHCLATALWRLRKGFAAAGVHVDVVDRDTIGIGRATQVWVDAQVFEARIEPRRMLPPELLGPADLRRLRHAVRLYRGDYLTGIDSDWAAFERQRLHDLYCDALAQLMLAHGAASQWRAATTWGRALCRTEPLREDVHRFLMTAAASTGDRAGAIAQYRQCERIIGRELGIEPMPETQALYRCLLGHTPKPETLRPTLR